MMGDDDFYVYVKDLSIFRGEANLKDILIIDNNIVSFAFNLENGIPILNFMGDKRDNELLKLMKHLNHMNRYDDLMAENERIY